MFDYQSQGIDSTELLKGLDYSTEAVHGTARGNEWEWDWTEREQAWTGPSRSGIAMSGIKT